MPASKEAVQERPAAEAVLAKAVLSAAERLGLRSRQLAAVIGSSEASISRLQHGRGLDPGSKEGELALLFIRLYRGLDTLGGGDDAKARLWLAPPHDHLPCGPSARIAPVGGVLAGLPD